MKWHYRSCRFLCKEHATDFYIKKCYHDIIGHKDFYVKKCNLDITGHVDFYVKKCNHGIIGHIYFCA
jgi:hypothetical protein